MSDYVGPVARIGLTAAGYYFGGPLGGAVGSIAGGLLFPAGQDVEGPRLDDLSVQTSQVGAPVPIVYGTFPIAGNVFWAQPLREEESTQSAGKGGGPEVTEYSYFATFAVGLCEGTIVGVRRIWANKELVYDVRPQVEGESEDAFLSRLAQSKVFASYFTLYFGTEDQDPDPTIEANEGAGTVPGFRGLAYLVFDGLPVDQFGRRVPQLEVEVVGSGAPEPAPEEYSNEVLYPWTTGTEDPRNCKNDHEYRVDYLNDSGESAWFESYESAVDEMDADLGYSVPFVKGWMKGEQISSISPFENVEDEDYIRLTLIHSDPGIEENFFTFVAEDDQSTTGEALGCSPLYEMTAPGASPIWANNLYVHPDNGLSNMSGQPYRTGLFVLVTGINENDAPAGFEKYNNCVSGFSPDSQPAIKRDGYIDVRRVPRAPDNPCKPQCEPDRPLVGGGAFCVVDGKLASNVDWERDESTTYKVLSTYDENGNGLVLDRYPLGPARPEGHDDYDDEAFWTAAYQDAVDAGDLPDGMTYNANGDGGINTYPRTQAFAYKRTPYEDPLGSNTVPLSSIVADLCDRAGLSHYDASALSDVDVHGFAVGRVMTSRAAIRSLRQFGLFDGGEIDGELRFVRRGGSSQATLAADELGAHEGGSERPPAVRVERTQDVELPRRLRVHYRSVARDYEAGEQSSGRLTTDAVQVQDVEIPVAMTDDQAAQLAEILLYEAWMGRDTYSTAVAIPQLGLSPTDAITLPVDGAQQRARIVSTDYRLPGVIDVQLVRDDGAIYSSARKGESGGFRPPVLSALAPTEAVILDLPALTSDDDRPGYWVAMRGTLPRWPAATLFRSSDDGASWSDVAGSATQATMGRATTALPNADPTVWDRGNTLQVTLDHGELAGVAESEVLNGANAAALEVRDENGSTIGWEIIQFAESIQQGDGSWLLSDLLRGRRGTEWASDGHAAGDRFVMLTAPGIVRVPMSLAAIGQSRPHRAVTIGYDIDIAADIDFAGNAVALKPYAPVHLGAESRDGNLYLTCTRRARIGGEWQDGTGVPLGESEERYEFDILRNGAVIRTLSATQPRVLYPSSGLLTDFGGAPDTLAFRAYQLSAEVGRGYPAEATVAVPNVVTPGDGSGGDDAEEPAPAPSTDSALVAFTGTFSTDDRFEITVIHDGGRQQFTVDAAGQAALSDLADGFKAQVEAAFPALTVTKPSAESVKVAVSSGTIFVSHQSNSVLHSTLGLVKRKQKALPPQSGVSQQVSIDLYEVVGGLLTESPDFSSAYNAGGFGRLELAFYGLTYEAEKAQGAVRVEKILTWSTPVAPSNEYGQAISGVLDAVNESEKFVTYGLSGQAMQQGPGEARPKARLLVDSNYRIVPDIFSPNAMTGHSHPSGFRPYIKEVVAGKPDLPSGAKQVVIVDFSVSGTPTEPIAEGMQFTVTLDGVDYTASISAGDITGALYYDDAYSELKTLIEASGDYDVTLIRGTNNIVSPTEFTYRMAIERNVVNTPFTYDAYASYGARVEVTMN